MPDLQGQNPFNAWSRDVSHTFNEAYRLPEDTGLEAQQIRGEYMVQALNLPQLRSFVNNRI